MRLRDFGRDDILEALMRNRAMAGKTLDDLSEVADFVMAGADTVGPDIAYTRLYAWSQT